MKYALVTGGSRGIGRAVCVKLSSMGYSVLINYVNNQAEAQHTLDLIHDAGNNGDLIQFDVSDREQVQRAIETWQDAHPDDFIEVLVNNAGIRKDQVLALMPEEDWTLVLDITLKGFYHVTQQVLPSMVRRKYGRIINMSSVSGISGTQGQTNYSAAKGGLIAATKALAKEVARKNITVNAVAPGFIRTDMVEGMDEVALKQMIPLHRLGTPEEVAEVVGFLASPNTSYITGDVISINGGLYL